MCGEFRVDHRGTYLLALQVPVPAGEQVSTGAEAANDEQLKKITFLKQAARHNHDRLLAALGQM